jgi:hypothetical protein
MSMLVTASYQDDADGEDEEDDDDNADVVEYSHEEPYMPSAWLKKGRRIREAERRAKRLEMRRKPCTV